MLQLRKMTQPLLDALGLEDLHTEIRQSVFTIVGSCGKPLVPINGIMFGSKPTTLERDYATELFEKFLDKHGANLKVFVEASKAFNTLEVPEIPSGMYRGSYYSKPILTIILPAMFQDYSATNISFGSGFIQCSQAISFSKLTEIVDTYQGVVDIYLDALNTYQEQSILIDDMRRKLQTCTI